MLNKNVGKIVVYAMNDDDDDANEALGEGGGRFRSISTQGVEFSTFLLLCLCFTEFLTLSGFF